MNKIKNLCFFSFIGSDNLGDEAVFYSMITNFKNTNHHLSVISTNPDKTKKLLKDLDIRKLKIINVKHNLNVIKVIKKSDIFICGGGGIIQDQTSIFNLPFFLSKVFLAKFFKKTIMFYGIGVGPLKSRLSRLLTKIGLNFAEIITVRDNKSKKILINCGVKEKIINVTADPAISIKKSLKKEISLLTLNKKINSEKLIMVICLRHWFDTYRFMPVKLVKALDFQTKKDKKKYENFINEISKFLNYCNEKLKYQLIFLPFWINRDNKVHRNIIDKLDNKKDIYLLNKEYSPSQTKGIIQKADFVLGMRLHSLILATTSKTPFIAINYSQKVRNYLKMLFSKDSLVDKISVNPENFSSEELIEKLNFILKNNTFTSENFKKNFKKLLKKEKENFIYLKEVINK
ncbi:MAG: polysaccharide pyruvyl transferase family protein [Nanoarchaeota archaeon]|nr:polysaccharide pyruvyl transferase family protein [Nanoarchaeota archaeon]